MTRSERQQMCVDNWIKLKCKASVVCPTGFGKTRIAILAIKKFLLKNPGKRILVVVPSEALQMQWNNVIAEQGLQLNCIVKIINTVSTHKDTCDFLVIDEVHKIGSVEFIKVLENVEYSIILGLTATLERLDGRHKILEKYMPICDTVTPEEAIANKWLSPVKQYLVLITVDDIEKYEKLNQDFISYFSAFNYDFKAAMNCITDFRFRANYIKERCAGKTKEEQLSYSKYIHASAYGFLNTLKARKKFCYEHPKKIELANLIIQHNQDKKGITFWKTIKMCEQLDSGFVLHSQQSKAKRALTLEEFNKQKTGWIHSSKSLIEGVDCPNLNTAIVGGFDSSKTTNIQRLGRIIRFEEGKEAEMYILCIRGTVEEKWWKNSSTTDYVTITEQQLINKLNNNNFQTIKNSRHEKTDIIFRF